MKPLRLFLIIFAFSGCQMDITGFVKYPEKLSDQRFNGEFSRVVNSVVYGLGSRTYYFDGTTYAIFCSLGDRRLYLDYEIEVFEGKYREKLWKNDDSASWDEWDAYHFDNDGDLWIGILEYKKK